MTHDELVPSMIPGRHERRGRHELRLMLICAVCGHTREVRRTDEPLESGGWISTGGCGGPLHDLFALPSVPAPRGPIRYPTVTA